jgi:hypothetical protein
MAIFYVAGCSRSVPLNFCSENTLRRVHRSATICITLAYGVIIKKWSKCTCDGSVNRCRATTVGVLLRLVSHVVASYWHMLCSASCTLSLRPLGGWMGVSFRPLTRSACTLGWCSGRFRFLAIEEFPMCSWMSWQWLGRFPFGRGMPPLPNLLRGSCIQRSDGRSSLPSQLVTWGLICACE